MSAIALAAAALGAFSVSPPQGDAGAEGRPETFALAIGNGQLSGGPEAVAERLGDYDLVVIDGELATAEDVAALRAAQTHVLAYLSVGTIEKWRSWYPRLRRYRLGAWADWKDEWFADVSKAGLRRAITQDIAPQMLDKGFEGLFLDNVDMIETRNHRTQRPGMRRLVGSLEELVHRRGRLLFTQNGAWGLRKLGLVDSFDGWNREDVTWTYDFDRRRYMPVPASDRREALSELSGFAERGLVTTATDYTRAGDEAALRESIENACSAGAVPYVSDVGLTARRLPAPPLRCP